MTEPAERPDEDEEADFHPDVPTGKIRHYDHSEDGGTCGHCVIDYRGCIFFLMV